METVEIRQMPIIESPPLSSRQKRPLFKARRANRCKPLKGAANQNTQKNSLLHLRTPKRGIEEERRKTPPSRKTYFIIRRVLLFGKGGAFISKECPGFGFLSQKSTCGPG